METIQKQERERAREREGGREERREREMVSDSTVANMEREEGIGMMVTTFFLVRAATPGYKKNARQFSHCGTQFTFPGDLCFIVKNIVRNIHAALVVPSLTSHHHREVRKGNISASNLPSAALSICDHT